MFIRKSIVALCTAVVAAYLVAPASGATLSVTKKGIVIDNGGEDKFTINYPVPVNTAKKAGKVSEATVDEADAKKATVKYEGGGTLTVTLKDDQAVLRFSEMPEGTKTTLGTITIPAPFKGKYQAGKAEAKDFPAEKAEKAMLFQGSGNQLVITGGTDTKTYLVIPDFSYIQLQDMRHYGSKSYLVQFWAPFYPENPSRC